jgi:prephenate dehydrogenase
MSVKNIAIIGLGLIGGSLAKALKQNRNDVFISAFDNNEILSKALNDNVIDQKLIHCDDSLNSDIIFLCLPTGKTIEVFETLSNKISENQILTDVCSIKYKLQEIWDKKNCKGIYIGGHPMTGKEKGGYENSDSTLFENCVYILNESAKDLELINGFTDIIKSIGAKITFLNPKVHDIIVASVSHLPQLVAVSLINSAGLKDSELNFFDFAAGGFRDMTRIGASEFQMWESIIQYNNKNIVQAIDNFIYDLEQTKKFISSGKISSLADRFESARIKRDEIPKSTKGFINSLFDLFIYVKDEPGVLAKLTTVLFENKINIKDLELLKIREGTGGTFRISFENQSDADKAKKLIEQLGFSVKI